MTRKSDTRALTGRDPANRPETHAVMTPEFFNGASTYRMSLDRQGMSLGLQHGGRFGNPTAESNDKPGDVNEAINGPDQEVRGMTCERDKKPSGQGLKGYGR